MYLFQSYVDTWLKIKVEASGWPTSRDTEDQRQAYIADFYVKEGIALDYDKIEHNPGLRPLAKMLLNSMWGKFGQRLDKIKVNKFTEPQPFQPSLDSDHHDVRYVSGLTEQDRTRRMPTTFPWFPTSTPS